MAARLRLPFLAVGLGFLAVACARMLRDGSHALPSWPALTAAFAVTAVGLIAAAGAWVALAPAEASRPALWAGFMAGQLGKYIPGGIWLGVGQVGFGMAAGLTAAQALGALVVYALCLVAAGGFIAGVAGAFQPMPLLWLAAPGAVALLLLARRWHDRLFPWGARALGRRAGEAAVPSQLRTLHCLVRVLVALGCSGLSYWLLISGAGVQVPLPDTLFAFAVAWLAGFLAIGLPSGIGAREAALALMLDAGSGVVVATALIHRLIQGMAEVALLLTVRGHRATIAGSRTAGTSAPEIVGTTAEPGAREVVGPSLDTSTRT